MTVLLGANAGVIRADESAADSALVTMWLHGAARPGLWLKGQPGGWSLPLPVASLDSCTAKLRDVSPGLPHEDRIEALAPGQDGLMLPRPRYTGSHTYRLTVQCDDVKTAELMVHLEPSAAELASWGGVPTMNGPSYAKR